MKRGLAIVIAPNVNPALAAHPRFAPNVEALRSWGLSVLWEPEPAERPWMVPWSAMLNEIRAQAG